MRAGLTTSDSTPVLVTTPLRRPHAQVRLYCLPYAGGSASAFQPWAGELPDGVELCPIELPGRGYQMGGTPAVALHPLARSVAGAIQRHADRRFAILGHSMGALIAFEAARELQRRGQIPQVLFASAHRAPQLPRRHPITHTLSDAELIMELRRLNGTPPEVFQSPELLECVMPILRADLQVCQTYSYEPGKPLVCPIDVLGGVRDAEVSQAELDAWRYQTSRGFSLTLFDGDHFFITQSARQVIASISVRLSVAMT